MAYEFDEKPRRCLLCGRPMVEVSRRTDPDVPDVEQDWVCPVHRGRADEPPSGE
ncbi:hypothetical protein ACIRJS_32895 [Streptomyces sp. NPDC102340]|uniref:hypothetical protein n=1 Tax=unclassified Streptomyces TaxID=2593676 RepID=UPI00381D2DB5